MDQEVVGYHERTVIVAPWIKHDERSDNKKHTMELKDGIYSIIVSDIRFLATEDIEEILGSISDARIMQVVYSARMGTFYVLES